MSNSNTLNFKCCCLKRNLSSQDANDGDIYFCSDTNEIYMYHNSHFMLIENTYKLRHQKQEVKRTKCKNCGATIPLSHVNKFGDYTCKYCRSTINIYEP